MIEFNYKAIIKEKNNRIKNLLNKCDEKGKEIERLQREKEELQVNGLRQETLFKLEIERLNNIINDFEEELERESNMKEEDTCLEHNTFIDIRSTLKTVLKRFKELKGSDK